ncbi:MAG: DUF2007 domain-containing protein [Acidobacteria bacterium]|nr:DUF2007 domain-containing protein [Acidobacteriota bacterium]
MNDTVVIRSFQDPMEANLAKGRLEAEGIPCFLADENIVGIQPFYGILVGGIKLTVRAADAGRATALLDGEPTVDGAGPLDDLSGSTE